MKRILMLLLPVILVVASCSNPETSSVKNSSAMPDKETQSLYTQVYKANTSAKTLACKLAPPELQQRKATVLKHLQEQVLMKRELENGYAFQFLGTDEVLEQLIEFIKTERACCEFFVFGLSISGDKSEIWLELTGPEGAKAFIAAALGV